MSNIHKRALRKAAMHARTTDDWGCDADNFHDKATPDAVLALLDELEATYSRIGELEVIATDYGMKFQKAQDAMKHQSLLHKSQMEAAEKRIAELSQKADIYDMLRQDYELQGSLVDFVDWQAKRIAEMERKEQHSERQSVIDALAASGEAWSDIEEYMQEWDAARASAAGKGE